MEKERKVLYSGMQATGKLTIGNYIGALKNWVNLHEDYDCFFGVMDLHSLTVRQNPTEFRQNARRIYTQYVAAGLDPQKNCIYFQSHVPAHAQLGWILDCYTYMGELNRMTQFKDKKEKQVAGVSAGLLTYPSLMAADILLYDADVVPVGKDQKQHLELTRTLAERFNNKYGETFVVPEPFIAPTGAKIMSLVEPEKKMSKSDPNPKGYISLLDDLAVIKKKIKSAVTDSDGTIKYDVDNKPGISNLLTILSCCTNTPIKDLEEKYKDSNYATFKEDVANAVVAELEPIQAKYNELINSDEIDRVLDEGRDYASYLAKKKLDKVYNKVGLGRKR